MSIRTIILAGASLAVLAACGEKAKEAVESVPAVEEVVEQVQVSVEEQAAEALERSGKFLADNAKLASVSVQESGLQIETVIEGEGPSPSANDFVTVHYTGTLMDGSVFDSSVERGEPVTLQLTRVVDGWQEGLQLMKQGGKSKLILPPELAYGEAGTPDGSIGPNEAIIFDVELIEVIAEDNRERLTQIMQEAQARYAAEMQTLSQENTLKEQAFLAQNLMEEGIEVTATGLQYKVIEKGAGDKSPVAADSVIAHYSGRKLSGEEFDSSYSRGEPTTFPLSQVIAGWTEGLQLMNTGDKYRFYIPSSLAYGASGRGPIGPNEMLIFDVELVDVLAPEAQEEPAAE